MATGMSSQLQECTGQLQEWLLRCRSALVSCKSGCSAAGVTGQLQECLGICRIAGSVWFAAEVHI
jgi:hypothetical protein